MLTDWRRELARWHPFFQVVGRDASVRAGILTVIEIVLRPAGGVFSNSDERGETNRVNVCWPAKKRGRPWSGEDASQRDIGVARQVILNNRATNRCAPSVR